LQHPCSSELIKTSPYIKGILEAGEKEFPGDRSGIDHSCGQSDKVVAR